MPPKILIGIILISFGLFSAFSCGHSKTCYQSPIAIAGQFMRVLVEGKHDELATMITDASLLSLSSWETSYNSLAVRQKNKLRNCSFLFSQDRPTIKQKNGSVIISILASIDQKEILQILHITKDQNCYAIDWASSEINIIKLVN